MHQVSSLALAAALVRSAAASGCYDPYSATATYNAGDMVSKTSGTTTYNYECKHDANSAYCRQSAFAPGGIHSGTAWTMESAPCEGVAFAAAAPWTGDSASAACPEDFVPGASYQTGETRAVAGTDPLVKDVYECVAGSMHLYCGQTGFSPGTSQHWSEAWTMLGQCATSHVPVPDSSPFSNPVPDNLGACPLAWTSGAAYGSGDSVSKNGIVYQCTEESMVWNHCKQTGYEPGTGLHQDSTDYWTFVWNKIGVCDVTTPLSVPVSVLPVPVPVPVSAPGLPFMAGCPGFWSAGANYEVSDLVTFASPTAMQVYECKPYPVTSHCSEAEHAPGTAYASIAWTLKATCTGSMAPTSAPVSFSGVCFYTDSSNAEVSVEPWDSSKDYVVGDVVRVGSERFKCLPFPTSVWCSVDMYAPTLDPLDMWTIPWKADGICTPPAPTMSPKPSSSPSTQGPTESPTATPSLEPSSDPSDVPSAVPNFAPSDEPSGSPSDKPSGEPSSSPSDEPSGEPSVAPSDEPSMKPSLEPSKEPSMEPSDEPSNIPSGRPSVEPSDEPSMVPSGMPSGGLANEKCTASKPCASGFFCDLISGSKTCFLCSGFSWYPGFPGPGKCATSFASAGSCSAVSVSVCDLALDACIRGCE